MNLSILSYMKWLMFEMKLFNIFGESVDDNEID